MEINYSPKKVWNDLKESKDSLKYLISIGVILIFLGIIDVILNAKFFSTFGNMILFGYFALLANNIIKDKKPVLEDLSKSEGIERNLFILILKQVCISFVYTLLLALVGALIIFVCAKFFTLEKVPAIIITTIFVLPLMIPTIISQFLFSENLKLREALNIKRAFQSFGVAWKKYVIVFGIYLLLAIAAFLILIALLIPLSIAIPQFLKLFPTLNATKESFRMTGGIIGSTFGEIGAIILSYWYYNAVAQVYKYSLTKLDSPENMDNEGTENVESQEDPQN